ncbi:MAG: NUDIX hydrolase, partial [Candidatus Magasanikbacteria bacterium GW2011_GWA2_37_8]
MEYIDIVDDNDQVIGRATRDEVNEKHLRCRIVHALVFNNKGEMAIHLRSAQR